NDQTPKPNPATSSCNAEPAGKDEPTSSGNAKAADQQSNGSQDTLLLLGSGNDQRKPVGKSIRRVLWERFQKEADRKKQELIKIGTLHVGLMGAVVGFAAKECFGGEQWAMKPAALLVAVSVVGLILATLARYSIAELSNHVVSSWDLATKARKGHKVLHEV